jgi:hypothetical protein
MGYIYICGLSTTSKWDARLSRETSGNPSLSKAKIWGLVKVIFPSRKSTIWRIWGIYVILWGS